jgi:glycerophosphoryl diester phosphodiesterase
MFFSVSAVWGHRGWPSRYPDNVEAGIRAAAEVAGGVEIDIRRSADGHLVLSHDPDIEGAVVADHPWSTLSVIDLSGHRPTLLEAVLDVDVPLDLEVKNDPSEPGFEADHRLARDVADQARPGDMVTSFWWPSVDAVRSSHPHVSTGLLFEAPIDGLLAVRHAVDRGHHCIAPQHGLVDETLMQAAGKEGITVVTWTVDDGAEAMRLDRLGVDAIITNRPGELIAEQPKTGSTT